MNKKRPDGLMDWILTGIFAALAARGTKKLITADHDTEQQQDAHTPQSSGKVYSDFRFGGWDAFYLLVFGVVTVICYFGHLDHLTEDQSERGLIRIFGILGAIGITLFVHSRLLNPSDRTSIHLFLICVYWVVTIYYWSGDTFPQVGSIEGLIASVATSMAVLWSIALPCYWIFNPLFSLLLPRR